MTSFHGLNIRAQQVANKQRLIEYFRGAKPAWGVVIDGVGLAREIKDASPESNIIVRRYPEGGDGAYIRMQPEVYLHLMRYYIGDADVWCYTDNEVGLALDWHIALLEANAKLTSPLKLCILNISVGTPPDPSEWLSEKAQRLLKLASEYSQWCVIGLHEYFAGVVTSGLIGGYPDNAGVQPGEHGGENFVHTWPKIERVKTLTKFHLGRFEFLSKACRDFEPPRIVLTEHGADNVSDIKTWLDTLEKMPPYNEARGFRSLENQWRTWWPQWTLDQAYYEQLNWAYRAFYQNTPVEGACLFLCGGEQSEWRQFNVEQHEELLSLCERNQVGNVPATIPITTLLPAFPVDFDQRSEEVVLSAAGSTVNIRSKPTVASALIGRVGREGQSGWIIRQPRPNERITENINEVEGTWLPVEVGNVQGWVFGGHLKVQVIQPTSPTSLDIERLLNLVSNIATLVEDMQKLLEQQKG
jgi:hypothetical protein